VDKQQPGKAFLPSAHDLWDPSSRDEGLADESLDAHDPVPGIDMGTWGTSLSTSAIDNESSPKTHKTCISCREDKNACDSLTPCGHCQSIQASESCTYQEAVGRPAPSLNDHTIPQAGAMQSYMDETHSKLVSPQLTPTSVATTDQQEPQFACPTCHRKFSRRNILVNHERTHTGEKPYACSFEGCNKTFAQQGDQTRHEQAQHFEKSFQCGDSQSGGPSWGCGKRFRRKDGLLEHHSKTKKGKQCLADRDKLVRLESAGDQDKQLLLPASLV